ncbi:DoxX family protein [Mycobacteroides stephanolepidis]|uniref:DoxX family protein n=1 Tax=[Mycobacterium] stephanolepidis TaxID=1520670 RepID=UPI001E4AA120|nr:DoxX family protein [[Mycobacterium] stephanolepidis]
MITSGTDRRILLALGAFQAVDAALCIQPIPYVGRCLDTVRYPKEHREIFPIIKGASAIGLLAGARFPALAKLTLVMLSIYFSFAFGAHVRVRDVSLNAAAAGALLVTYTALTTRELIGRSVNSSS